MTLHLDTISRDEHQLVRIWRKSCRETLRTTDFVTEAQQDEHYRTVVSCPGRNLYFAIRNATGEFLGEVQLQNIDRVNRHAEIGLLVNPALHGQGIGREAVALVLHEAFAVQNLRTVWLECYLTGHVEFWKRILESYGGSYTIWPRRKFWLGDYHDAILGTIPREGWERSQRPQPTRADATGTSYYSGRIGFDSAEIGDPLASRPHIPGEEAQ